MEKVLIIVRGMPGSGKTTFANLVGQYVCASDDYLSEDGNYSWSPEKYAKAHKKCLDKVEWGMGSVISKIFVTDVAPKESDLKEYYDLADYYGYKVISVIVENRHGGVNEHNVPEETMNAMLNAFNIKLI